MDPIEEKLAHLERLVDDLNAVVTRQDREIATLTARVALLMEREAAREAEGGGGAVFGDERPPHY
ncbi:MAG: SlyX family protein [Pseudomonadota bacterium]